MDSNSNANPAADLQTGVVGTNEVKPSDRAVADSNNSSRSSNNGPIVVIVIIALLCVCCLIVLGCFAATTYGVLSDINQSLQDSPSREEAAQRNDVEDQNSKEQEQEDTRTDSEDAQGADKSSGKTSGSGDDSNKSGSNSSESLFDLFGESKLPEKLPSDVPIYKGDYKVTLPSTSESSSGLNIGFSLIVQDDKKVQGVVNDYKSLLNAQGWKISSESELFGMYTLEANKTDNKKNKTLYLSFSQGGLFGPEDKVTVLYSYEESNK